MSDGGSRKIYGLLSLCRKAGFAKSGEVPVVQAVTSMEAKLVVIAGDASDNTKKRYMDKCDHRGMPWVVFGDMESIGRALGTGDRSGAAVVDKGFADALTKLLPRNGDRA